MLGFTRSATNPLGLDISKHFYLNLSLHACMEDLVDNSITLVDQVVMRKKDVYTLR